MGFCKYYIGSIGDLSLSTAPATARNRPSMYSFFAQKWYGLIVFLGSVVTAGWDALVSHCWLIYGGCRWRRRCSCIKWLVFLQQNTTASLLKLYFNDSMQTVRARQRRRRRWQSRKRGRRWADVVFTDTGSVTVTTVRCSFSRTLVTHSSLFFVQRFLRPAVSHPQTEKTRST